MERNSDSSGAAADNFARGVLPHRAQDVDPRETAEWEEAIQYVIESAGPERAAFLLDRVKEAAFNRGVPYVSCATTPYINTIPPEHEPTYPGDRELERKIKSLIRWNAMAMVVRANRKSSGIGGHISTYASAATLYEVAFHHFFRGKQGPKPPDQVFFQGHASPGIYARAFLEGRLSEEQMKNFRRELAPGGGLSSYPHPWLMPGFWEFPTVSMGLGPIMAIYQARFNHYLADRGIKPDAGESRVWAFLGDGECDEPETLGAITLAAREKLDNLIFVINCNLQRLDGPVRGNGKIIQELEAIFRGAGWNVIKVVWGSDWDPLLARDADGLLVRRMNEVVDGQYQKYTVMPGSYTRKHFFGADPRLEALVADLTDEQIRRLKRGGHDPVKVYAAYRAAVEHRGAPTVILAKTIKGYGLGEAGEGRNVTHQQKKLNEDELDEFRRRFEIPIPEDKVAEAPFYRPPEDSPEIQYLLTRRKELGGFLPARGAPKVILKPPKWEEFAEFFGGSEGRPVSTTMAFVRLLARLLRDKHVGRYIVPIVPDEARTFGMEALFRQFGIYAHSGQLYEPVDSDTVLYYREATDGQILEEGITEAGSMASFIAAGTAHSSHGVPMVPFFIYYSMFGLQRIGDLIWAAGDMRCRGFLLGVTAGRTTLAGEGLQHQDGNSPGLRPLLCLRDVGHRARRHPAHVLLEGGHPLLRHADERELRAPGAAHGRHRGDLPGDVRPDGSRPRPGQAQGATVRQRGDPARGAAGPGPLGVAVRRLQHRVQRHQLQGPLPGCPGVRALEPPPCARAAAQGLRPAGDGRAPGPGRGRAGLRQRFGAFDFALAAAAVCGARDRRLWAERGPAAIAPLL